MRRRSCVFLSLLPLLLPLAHAPSPSVVFQVPLVLTPGSQFYYAVTIQGFPFGNYSGYLWLSNETLCGWEGNLRNNLPMTLSCNPTVPTNLVGEQSTMFNANSTFYGGPVVLVTRPSVGGMGKPPLPT